MISAPFRQIREFFGRIRKHREENRPQPHAVAQRAEGCGQEGCDLQSPQRRDHAEGKERGETEQRKEHIESAAPDRSQPPLDGAQRIEHERQHGAQKQRREQRPRLIGDGHAHPKSRAKKPPPAAGSSA